MRKSTLALAVVACLSLAACATGGDYKDYLAAQEKQQATAAATAKPLLVIEAMEGQTITGLKRLEVNSPPANTGSGLQAPPPNAWAGVVGQGLSVVGTIYGIHAGAQAATAIAGSISNAGTAGYRYVQAPNSTATTTSTTTTAVGNTAITGNTVPAPAAPTVVKP